MVDGIDKAKARRHSQATKRGLKRAKKTKRETSKRLLQDRDQAKAVVVQRRFFGGGAGGADGARPAEAAPEDAR
jgi:hypothetical protein